MAEEVKYITFDTPGAPRVKFNADATSDFMMNYLKSPEFAESMANQGYAYMYGLEPVPLFIEDNVNDNAFTSSLKSNYNFLKQVGVAIKAATADVFGAKETQQAAMEKFRQYQLDAAAYMFRDTGEVDQDGNKIYLPRPTTVEEVLNDPNQLEAFAKYLASVGGQTLVTSAPIALATLTGAGLGSIVGPLGTGAGATGGFLASSFLFGVGDIYGELIDAAGPEGDPVAMYAFALGVPYAVAERYLGATRVFLNKVPTFKSAILKEKGFKKALKDKIASRTFLKDVAKSTLETGVREAGAEVIQETLNVTAADFLQEGKGFEDTYLNTDYVKRIGEAGAAGFFGGYGFGVINPIRKKLKGFYSGKQFFNNGYVADYEANEESFSEVDFNPGDRVKIKPPPVNPEFIGPVNPLFTEQDIFTAEGTAENKDTGETDFIFKFEKPIGVDGDANVAISIPKTQVQSNVTVLNQVVDPSKKSKSGFLYDESQDIDLQNNPENRTKYTKAKQKLISLGYIKDGTDAEVDNYFDITGINKEQEIESIANEIEYQREEARQAEEKINEGDTEIEPIVLDNDFATFDGKEGAELRDAISKRWSAYRRKLFVEDADNINTNYVSPEDRTALSDLGFNGPLGLDYVNDLINDTTVEGNTTVGRKKLSKIIKNKRRYEDVFTPALREEKVVIGEQVETINPLTESEYISITGVNLADPTTTDPNYVFNLDPIQRIREIKILQERLNKNGWKIAGSPWYSGFVEAKKAKLEQYGKNSIEYKRWANIGYHLLENPFSPKGTISYIPIASPTAIRQAERTIQELKNSLEYKSEIPSVKAVADQKIAALQNLINRATQQRIRFNQLLTSLNIEPITNWENFTTVKGLSALEKRLKQKETITKRRNIFAKLSKWQVSKGPEPRITYAFYENALKVEAYLKQELKRLGLKDVDLTVIKQFLDDNGAVVGNAGRFLVNQRAIEVALKHHDAIMIVQEMRAAGKEPNMSDLLPYYETTLHHETIHAMFELGLVTPQEKRILDKAADDTWIDQFNVKRDYGNLTLEQQREEAIAHAFAYYMIEAKHFGTGIGRVFRRLKTYLVSLANALTRTGFKTPTDIFNAMDAGIIGNRNRDRQNRDATKSDAYIVDKEGNPIQYNYETKFYPDPGARPGDNPAPFNRQQKRNVANQLEKLSKGIGDYDKVEKLGVWARFFGHANIAATNIPFFTPLYDAIVNIDRYTRTLQTNWSFHMSKRYYLIKQDPTVNDRINKAHDIAQMTGGVYRPNRNGQIIFTAPADTGASDLDLKAGETIILTGDAADAYMDSVLLTGMVNKEMLKSIIVGTGMDEQLIDTIKLLSKYGTAGLPDLNVLSGEQIQSLVENMSLEDLTFLRNQLASIGEGRGGYTAYLNETDGVSDVVKAIELLGSKDSGLQALVNEATKITRRDAAMDYAPLMRYGNYYISVKDLEGNLIWYQYFESKQEANDAYGKLRINYPTATVTPAARIDDAFALERQFISATKKDALPSIDRLAQYLSTSSAKNYNEISKELRSIIDKNKYVANSDQFYTARDKSVGLAGVPGYSGDYSRAYAQFIMMASGTIARNRFLSKAHKAKNDAIKAARDPKTKDPNLEKMVNSFFSYVEDPVNEYASFRRLGFWYYLGGNLSSALLQFMSAVQFTAPTLSEFGGTVKTGKEMGKALSDTAAMLVKGAGALTGLSKSGKLQYEDAFLDFSVLPADVRDAVAEAIANGTLKQGMAFLEGGMATGAGVTGLSMQERQKNFVRSFENTVIGGAFNTMESFSRITSFIAALRILRNNTKALEKAALYYNDDYMFQTRVEENGGVVTAEIVAERLMVDNFGEYNKFNRPQFMRGILALPALFQTYITQMFGRMYRNLNPTIIKRKYDEYGNKSGFKIEPALAGRSRAQNALGRKILAKQLLMIYLTAGMFGLPGIDDGVDLIEWLIKNVPGLDGIDVDLENELRQMMREANFGKGFIEMHNKGALNAYLGIDINRRIGFGNVPYSNQLKAMANVAGFRTSAKAEELLGAPGSVFISAIEGVAIDGIQEGNWHKAVQKSLPNFMQNFIKASYMADNRYVESTYGTVITDDITNLDVLKQVLGFTPAIVAKERQAEFLSRRLGGANRNLKRRYNNRITSALKEVYRSSKDRDYVAMTAAQKRVQELIREIIEINRKLPAHLQYIPDISALREQALMDINPKYRRYKEGMKTYMMKENIRLNLGLD